MIPPTAFLRDRETLFFLQLLHISILYSFRILPRLLFSGPYTPTSNGWSACVVCDGKQNRNTPWSLASLINSRLMWEAWPSMKRITGPVSRVLDAADKNNFLYHSRKCGCSIQPDSDTLKCLPDCPPLIPGGPQILPFVYDIGWKMLPTCWSTTMQEQLCILCLIHHLFHGSFLAKTLLDATSVAKAVSLEFHILWANSSVVRSPSTASLIVALTFMIQALMAPSVRAVAWLAGKCCGFLSTSFGHLHMNPNHQSLPGLSAGLCL